MVFTSPAFFLFFPAVFLLFYCTKENLRWLLLLGASFFFYSTFKAPYLIFILALVTGTSYFFGRWIDEAASQKNKLWLLWGGVICNASILIATKVMALAGHAAPGALTPNAPPGAAAAGTFLSIGVSYYVFQAISYLIDIYLEIDRTERHFGYFAVYLSFFPKLLQGPIERARSLLPQLKAPQKFEYETVKSGLLLFAWGLMKKLVVADGLSQVVDTAYNNIGHYSGGALLFATYCYYMQIFFDFSGYTDMARGTARMLGIELSTNFNKPYLATSISDFWRRWHISFSSWILDYIFKPLQMHWRERKTVGTAAALLVTFLISGVWHGATWCFVLWGLVHGSYMAASVFYKPYQKALYKRLGVKKGGWLTAWQRFVTFHLIVFSWIFFRAGSIKDALQVVGKMGSILLLRIRISEVLSVLDVFGKKDFAIVLFFMAAIMILESYGHKLLVAIQERVLLRWCGYVGLVALILIFARFHSSSEFIYLSF